jgi:hypothetical protein
MGNSIGKFLKIYLFLIGLSFSFTASGQVYIPDPQFRQFLKTYYPSTLNANELLLPSIAAEVTGVMNCSNKGLTSIEGIQYFIKITALRCENNRLTYIPSLATNLDSLTYFDCSNNLLTRLPEFKQYSQNLTEIYCQSNNIDTLPNLSKITGLVSLSCNNNRLTFEDLLTVPTAQLNYFNYSPQKSLQLPLNRMELIEGTLYQFPFPPDYAPNNSYKIFRNGGAISNALPNGYFTISDFNLTHQGYYYWEIKNPYLPELTLVTTSIELVLTNANHLIFTPNGDNDNDSYYINYHGAVKIYNRAGLLIKELQGPTLWDGTDLKGLELPIGSYIIQYNDDTILNVTLIR